MRFKMTFQKNPQKNPETKNLKNLKTLINKNKKDIIKFIHLDKSYKEIFEIIKLPCSFNTFNQICTKINFIKIERQKIRQARQEKTLELLKRNIPVTKIRPIVKLSYQSIYNIANNHKIILKNYNRSKHEKQQKPLTEKPYQMSLFDFNAEYQPSPKQEPYKTAYTQKPQIYPAGFTQYLKNKYGKYQMPHKNQCHFIMTDTSKQDFYCANYTAQIFTKSHYCFDCYIKAHTLNNTEKQKILTQKQFFLRLQGKKTA